ncbi:MAG: glycosyltransferase N-terminal domain-containing protein [Pseudomonadota bacterium]
MILYRFLVSLMAPFLAWSSLRRNGSLRALWPKSRKSSSQKVWIHAASNGEAMSIRPVLMALQERCPDKDLLVTTNTKEARALVESWGLPGTTTALAPLDLRWALKRFLRGNQITKAIAVENELWPNKLAVLEQCDVPIVTLGTRLSESSAKAWKKLPRLARASLNRFIWLAPQDAACRDRLVNLGVAPEKLRGVLSLKAIYRPSALNPEQERILALHDPQNTLLAASTHAGEEEALLEAFVQARETWPALHLILAPRHPNRAGEVATLLKKHKLSFQRHSKGSSQEELPDVTLADTLGEMALWYRSAKIVFVGGSLGDGVGGHTPYEPGYFQAALMHGPKVSNYHEIYARLNAARAAREVQDASALAQAILDLRDPAQQKAFAQAWPEDLRDGAGFDDLLAALEQHLRD